MRCFRLLMSRFSARREWREHIPCDGRIGGLCRAITTGEDATHANGFGFALPMHPAGTTFDLLLFVINTMRMNLTLVCILIYRLFAISKIIETELILFFLSRSHGRDWQCRVRQGQSNRVLDDLLSDSTVVSSSLTRDRSGLPAWPQQKCTSFLPS